MLLRLLTDPYLTEEDLEGLHPPVGRALLRRLRRLGWYADTCHEVLLRPSSLPA